MMVFSEKSTRTQITPWGMEVKKRLRERGMRQDDLVKKLQDAGYSIKKAKLSSLLKGIGTSKRQREIKFISELLEIPYS